MKRRIISIDEEKCNGCGLCAKACHEGAIGMVSGKAKLLREDYCDGLGDCLPACPMNAITFVEREAPAYNEVAVLAAKKAKEEASPCSCPGTACQSISQRGVLPTICLCHEDGLALCGEAGGCVSLDRCALAQSQGALSNNIGVVLQGDGSGLAQEQVIGARNDLRAEIGDGGV